MIIISSFKCYHYILSNIMLSIKYTKSNKRRAKISSFKFNLYIIYRNIIKTLQEGADNFTKNVIHNYEVILSSEKY